MACFRLSMCESLDKVRCSGVRSPVSDDGSPVHSGQQRLYRAVQRPVQMVFTLRLLKRPNMKALKYLTIFALRSPLQVDRSPALINLCSVVLSYPSVGSLTNRHSGHQLPSCNASESRGQCTKMLRIIVEFSQRSASTSRSSSLSFSSRSRLILDEFAVFSAVSVVSSSRPQSVSGQSGYPLRFLAHSVATLLPFGCGERQEHA